MSQLLPQAYLSNFHNRVKNEDVPLFIAAQLSRNKRGKQVNYAEFDTDLLDEFLERNDEEDAEDDVEASEGRRRGGDGTNGENGSHASAGAHPAGNGSELNSGAGNGIGTTQTGEDAHMRSLRDLPDLDAQEDSSGLGLLKYPKIRETFVQSKIAISYKDLMGDVVQERESTGDAVPVMIPIRLNIEFGGHKLIDFFMWNLTDNSLTPEQFATILCQDLDFPVHNNPNTSPYTQIISMINEQLQEYEALASLEVPDLHVIINLTTNLDSKLYDDTFEWNLNDESLCPEQFAELVVQDFGLQREFVPAIAHSLHESILKVKKDWLEGHLNQSHVENKAAFGYTSGIRLDIDNLGANWCPKVEVLSQWEIEKREIEKERNMRRLKRESAKVEDGRSRRRGKRRMDDLETTLRI